MSAERYRRLRALFDEALELPEAQRASWCAAACGDDGELLRDLQRLLSREAQQRHLRTSSAGAMMAAALDADATRRLAGTKVDRYTLCEEIGQGGMGRVFRATRSDGGVEQEVALKLLRRELINEAMLTRFRSERRILAGLNHPSIARLLDLGETSDGIPYVAMELVRGVAITRYCAQQRLDLRGRLSLFRQVLAAVSHAHRNLIVHRDIKPANVLVDAEGRIKLLDFGIAKPLQGDVAATETALRLLTPNYAAPEQFTGGDASVMTDVYALGALLYEILSGHPPFALDGLSAGEIERRVLLIPPESLTQAALDTDTAERLGQSDIQGWRKTLRGDLDSIVQKALRKEPHRRYLSAEQMDADIERYLRQEPVLASGNSRAYRVGKFVQRHRLLLAVVSGAFVAVSVALGLAIRQAHIAEAERDTARAAMAVIGESFRAADPMKVSGGQIRAADILRVAVEKTANLRADQPMLHAALVAELGEAELALGMNMASRSEVEAAIEWADVRGDDQRLLDRLLLLRARQSIGVGDFAAADRYLTELEERETVLSAPTRLVRSRYLIAAGRPQEAVERAQQALALLQGSKDRLAEIDALWQLSEAQNEAGLVDDALLTLSRVTSESATPYAQQAPKILLTHLRRARLLVLAGRADPAMRQVTEDVIAALSQHYPDTSTTLGFAYSVLAQITIALNDAKATAEAYGRAERAYVGALGPYTVGSLKAQFNHVEALTLLGDPLAHKGFDNLTRNLEAAGLGSSPLAAYFRTSIAIAWRKSGDRDTARAALLSRGFRPNLRELDARNREKLLGLVADLYGPIDCALEDARSDTARELLCGQ